MNACRIETKSNGIKEPLLRANIQDGVHNYAECSPYIESMMLKTKGSMITVETDLHIKILQPRQEKDFLLIAIIVFSDECVYQFHLLKVIHNMSNLSFGYKDSAMQLQPNI